MSIICKSDIYFDKYFYPFEVVVRGSGTHLQVDENIN